ncbi:hypothetical protein FHT70_002571 [Rhizobium sp. BK049]|uniref:ATP-binding protein n=1 Tax=Rhizobium sp. BK049 TaxID=2587095 RepID=UPI0016226F30|nr:DUF87 domain-containing protein [Rhizobium sp. BK049]MBB3352638.1 hypothetical protein [Rhizobium sp. BK049]
MNKNYGLLGFCAGMVLLLGLLWLHTGSLAPPAGADSIWFNAGLFTLLLGRFVTEYRFTKPNDVFLNCVAVFVGISSLTSPPHREWWEVLRWGSFFLGAAAVGLSWDLGIEARREESRIRSLIYQIAVALGKADVIFSLVFILAILSYFDVDNLQTKIFVITWGFILLAANLQLPTLARVIRKSRNYPDRKVLGVTHSFLAPSIVFCTRIGDTRTRLHQLVGFTQSGASPCHCMGIVIGERSSASETRIAIALIRSSVSEAQLNEDSLMVTVSDDERQAVQPPIDDAEVAALAKVVGTVAKGSTISQVKFELFGSPDVRAGSMLRVGSGNSNVFYQVFDGRINEEIALTGGERAYVEGEAEQIGRWDQQRGGFDTHDWVARERAPVFLMDHDEQAPVYTPSASEMVVGNVPNSNYNVVVDLHDLVLYHSAILGVTGSGKSFLTYALVEQCAQQGIKVVCVDPTGDYQRYLHDAVIVPGRNSLRALLNSNDHFIGVLETASSDRNPIDQTLEVAQACLEWCKANRQDADVLNPRPKILVVLEEAHLLVPEWNFNPTQNLRDNVNRTAQIVLQARKYGLGFLVVSQRTANVTKSVLNQCNTVVSFQAFDETGFDFLKNYMGSYHVTALPTLKARNGILVGKASRSRRPLMVHFNDQQREVRAQPAPNMPIPVNPAPANADL